MEEYNDKLNEIIVDRLKERKYKIDRINEMEMTRRLGFVRPLIGIAVAACVIGVVFISPWNRSSLVDEEAMRSATINVDSLVTNGDYDAALKIINTNIAKSDSIIKVLRNEAKGKNDEELDYLIQSELLNLEDLKDKKQRIENKKNKSK